MLQSGLPQETDPEKKVWIQEVYFRGNSRMSRGMNKLSIAAIKKKNYHKI